MRNDKLTVEADELYSAYMPFSEVCMHMRVAGKRMWFKMYNLPHPMVQLYYRRGEKKQGDIAITPLEVFSGPITTGEAGIYHQGTNEEYRVGIGFYCYPEQNNYETPA